LRGGKQPNYDATSVKQATDQLAENNQITKLMIDCSHANSQKDHNRQIAVCADVAQQLKDGNENIMGVMIESHLQPGRQDVADIDDLEYGKSITDACISWAETETLLRDLAEAVRARRGA